LASFGRDGTRRPLGNKGFSFDSNFLIFGQRLCAFRITLKYTVPADPIDMPFIVTCSLKLFVYASQDFCQFFFLTLKAARSGHYRKIASLLGLCFSARVSNPAKEHSMKKTLVRLIFVTAALLALSATTAMADGGGSIPWCPPGQVCN